MRTLKYHKLPRGPHLRVRRCLTAVSQEGSTVVYRCLTCEREHAVLFTTPDGRPMGEQAARFFARWHDVDKTRAATTGHCPYCEAELRKRDKLSGHLGPNGPTRRS